MSTANRAASHRLLLKRLDDVAGPLWILDHRYRLLLINDAAQRWLGVADEDLLGRVCHAGVDGEDPLTTTARLLSPPQGLDERSPQVVRVATGSSEPLWMTFLSVGDDQGRIFFAMPDGDRRPFSPATGADAANLTDALRIRERLAQIRAKDGELGGIAVAGSSGAAKRLRVQVVLASQSKQGFSIHGPAGCGAETIARRIHGAASKHGGLADPLIAVDGPLMDTELLEASLSPAASHLGESQPSAAELSARTSPLESGDTAVTLLIRGLDQTPLDVQQQLLDFRSEHGDRLRLIGLLSESVETSIAQERLLAPYLSVVGALTLEVPPLAKRVEDVALIAGALVDRRHASVGGAVERLSRAALDQLLLYPWPSNFDELDAAIRHAMSVCRGPAILPEHLPLAIRSFGVGDAKSRAKVVTSLDQSLRQFELTMIREAVESCGGNRSEAARRLGVSRARLIRRLDDGDEAAHGGKGSPEGQRASGGMDD